MWETTKKFGSGGIRTHAPEETGALNQRLRPLGHATLLDKDGKLKLRDKLNGLGADIFFYFNTAFGHCHLTPSFTDSVGQIRADN